MKANKMSLNKQLPKGEQGRSMQSPRDLVLMKYEKLRRKHNRSNKENLSLVEFLHVYYYKLGKIVTNNTDMLARLTVEIVQFDKVKRYINQVDDFNENYAKFTKKLNR